MEDSYFLGYAMQQKKGIMELFSAIFGEIHPRRIIEIGFGSAGFSVFLALYAYRQEIDFFCYDIKIRGNYAERNVSVIERLGFSPQVVDVFAIEEQIKGLLEQKSPVILLCDGGDKIRELNTFSRYLKTGDIIMAHDYQPQPGDDTTWVCEIADRDIECAVLTNGLEYMFFDICCQFNWVCLCKR